MNKKEKIVKIFDENRQWSLFLSLIVGFIFCLLYFKPGISTGGDDSGYVLRAMRLWEKGEFPQFQGPIYPIILAPFYALSNGNLLVLKLLSIPMFLGSLYFIFRTFKSSIQPYDFTILLLTLSINFYWLNYSSLTYSEALFNLIQFGIFYFFYVRFIRGEGSIKDIVILSILGILLLKTRALGAIFFITVFIYFISNKQWKFLKSFAFFSFLMVLLWDGLTHFILKDNNSIVLSQMLGLLRENPYDASMGIADISLVFERLFYNTNEYISKHLLQMLGLRGRGIVEANWYYTLIVIIFFIVAVYFNRSREKIISFSMIYLGIGMFIIFITPKMWSQARFIQPFIPIIYVVTIYEIRALAGKKWIWIPGFIISILFILQVFHAKHYVKDNRPVIEAYLNGDKYYDYTPDWQNYFRACEWIGENLETDRGKIACRKPQIAAILSNMDVFHGIYKVPKNKCSDLQKELGNEDENYIALDIEKFFENYVSESFSEALQKDFSGNIMDTDKQTNFRLFNIQDKKLYQEIISENEGRNYLLPIESLISEDNNYYVSFSDSLVQILKKNNIEYILLGNLRVYKEKRTEEVFSSVHNFMITITIKYPNMFEKIYETGVESKEPATVFKVNYDAPTRHVAHEDVYEASVPIESLKSMIDWTIQNSSNNDRILIGQKAASQKLNDSNLLFNPATVPSIAYNDFLNVFAANQQKYMIIDPAKFNPSLLDAEQSSAMLESFQGFVYIRNNALRLHIFESSSQYRRLESNSHINGCMVKIEDLKKLREEDKKYFLVLEPTYIFTQLQNANIKYIIEDNLSDNLHENIPKRVLFLVSRKYPDAFYKVMEKGYTDADRVSVYIIN